MKTTQCQACREAYVRFQINGRCRALRRGDVAHLTHSTWHYGTPLCEVQE